MLIEEMQSRIQEVNSTDKDYSVEYRNKLQKIDDWLQENTRFDIQRSADVCEIEGTSTLEWDDDEMDNGKPFLFTPIKSEEQKKQLIEVLEECGNLDDDWPFDFWVNKAKDTKHIICEVRREGDNFPGGFIVFKPSIEVDSVEDIIDIRDAGIIEDSNLEIILSLDIDSVYVTPSKRGKGYGDALRWAVTSTFVGCLYDIPDLPDESRKIIKNIPLKIDLNGSAYSIEGEKFSKNVHSHLEMCVEVVSDCYSHVFNSIEIENYFDYDFYYEPPTKTA